ncbi:flagellar hook-length control protein FliK [Pollutimonas sp. H1-120]|uniref:flagellar hook-length control protein FliK n=1 Tax=Pollutimonas sp. H1-120 TaxID=3148824 RepID=UPI003B51BCD6
MSIGAPSALGTLLVQRLDAALGTTLSQQANLVTGARPDAVTQAANPERADAARTETQRHPREIVDRATAQTEQQGRGAVDKARLDARTAALLLGSNLTNTATTPSAPTTLGQAARTILALLANYPEQAAALQGKQPLLQTRPNPLVDARAQSPGQAPVDGAQQTAGRGAGAAGQSAAGAAAAGSGSVGATVGSAAGATAGTAGSANTAGPVSAGASAAAAAGTALQTAAAPAQLAQTLAQVLQTSGMFYESHLGNLAFGKQNLAQLMLEPQAQAGRAPAGNAPSHASLPASGEPGGARGAAENAALNTTAVRAGDAGGNQAGVSTAQALSQHAPALLASGMDPQTHLLVRQQLEVLANQTFAWRGEAWPDAPMEWEISRRDAQGDDASPQTEHWATRINIHLPELGKVQAQLTLAGRQLVMHLVAPDSAGLLGRHTEALRGRYSAQGLQLSQLSIASEEKASSPTSIVRMGAEIDKSQSQAAETGNQAGKQADADRANGGAA